MKTYLIIGLSVLTAAFFGCSNGKSQSKESLTATEFAEKVNDTPNAVVLDVRTPDEFSKGHLSNAVNIDWKGTDFDGQTAKLDKSTPVFVYCMSGSRSASAANKMRTDGFKEVYELKGGIMKWREANLPETTETPASEGMNRQQFNNLIQSDKLVLVDFYADWCAPCKKMEPYLNEISKDMTDKVTVVRINADDNKELLKELQISSLPVLQLYKSNVQVWTNTGYIDKTDVLKVIQNN